ncbi:MAG: hypothetical protein HRU15_15585 [Planctomycetes bacterium]|nr:hypothetical protein [Planctomycetota bacterium]
MTKTLCLSIFLSLILCSCGDEPTADYFSVTGSPSGAGGGGSSGSDKADLTITEVTAPETDLIVGETYSIEYTVTNSGSGSAAADWTTRFETSNGDIIDDVYDSILDSGESFIYFYSFTPVIEDIGNFSLTVSLDFLDIIDESDETNNVNTDVDLTVVAAIVAPINQN